MEKVNASMTEAQRVCQVAVISGEPGEGSSVHIFQKSLGHVTDFSL